MYTDSPEPGGIAPEKSEYVQRLIEAAGTAGVDASDIHGLLWLLNAPGDLAGLSEVLPNVAEILATAEAQWPGILEFQGLEAVPPLLERILPIVPGVSCLPESNRDWVSRNALYCALRRTLSSTQELRPRYLLLQAHFFFAHSAFLFSRTSQSDYFAYGGAKEWPALTISPYHAGLCIRHMAEQQHSHWASEFLSKLPVTLSPRELPFDSTVNMAATRPEFIVQKKVNYVSDYLCQIYDVKPRGQGHGSSPGRLWTSLSEIGDPDDPSLNFGILADWQALSSIHGEAVDALRPPGSASAGGSDKVHVPGTEQTEADREDREIDTDEFPDEDEADGFGGSLECPEEQYEKSTGSFEGRVHGSSNQLIRQQKMFRFGIEHAAGGELAGLGPTCWLRIETLLQDVRRRDNEPNRAYCRALTPLSKLQEAETLLFLFVMLWTGSTPERTVGLFVQDSDKELQDGIEFAMTRNDPFGRWALRISVPFPAYKTEVSVNPPLDCARTRYVWLPDHIGIYAGVSCLARKYGYRRSFRLFQKPVDVYKSHARQLLKAWDPSGRLTLNKISSALFARVMSVTGNDGVAATMITGNKHRLTKVPMYYACRRLGSIQAIYRQTVNNLLAEIGGEGRTGPSTLWAPRSSDADRLEREEEYYREELAERLKAWQSVRIAARPCPTTEQFRDAIGTLKASLRKPYKSSSDEAWIEFHNRYTFYTVWQFNIAVGSRKLKTPYIDIATVSPLNGVALYRDKDGDAGTKAKLIWIPDLVQEQMRRYALHLLYIRSRFRIARLDLPCFFLSNQGHQFMVRPKSMFPFVAELLPGYAVDIHRRFVFNALLESGCPPEATRVWMGHACAGEEWWADYATYSHLQHRQLLGQYLIPILKELGFELLAGAVPDRAQQEAVDV